MIFTRGQDARGRRDTF